MSHRTLKRRSQAPRRILRAGVGAIVLVIVAFAVLELTGVTHLFRTDTTQSDDATSEQQRQQAAADADEKREFIENTNNSPKSDQGDKPAGSDSDPDTTQTDGSLSLTAQKLSNGTVTVHTGLGDVADGSCRLDVSNGAATNSQTADVIYVPDGSTCAGFSVPISSVGYGIWKIKLTVTPLSGPVLTKTISQEIE